MFVTHRSGVSLHLELQPLVLVVVSYSCVEEPLHRLSLHIVWSCAISYQLTVEQKSVMDVLQIFLYATLVHFPSISSPYLL